MLKSKRCDKIIIGIFRGDYVEISRQANWSTVFHY